MLTPLNARLRAPALAALGLAAMTAAACAPSEPAAVAGAETASAAGQCFLPRQVNGFSAVDDDTVDVSVGANDVYRLDIAGACPNVDWSLQVGIRSTGGGSWVCHGHDAELIVPSPIGVQQCPVVSVRKLTEEEAEASEG